LWGNACRRIEFQNPSGLKPLLTGHDFAHDAGPFKDDLVPGVAQYRFVKKDISTAFRGDDEAISFYSIEPFDRAPINGWFVFPPTHSLIPCVQNTRATVPAGVYVDRYIVRLTPFLLPLKQFKAFPRKYENRCKYVRF
jgi:hypothetical protein